MITAARNEEKYIQNTIDSILSQTVLPKKWVIISDSSTDDTDRIIEHNAIKHAFIQFIRFKGDEHRTFGSKIRAFNKGCEMVGSLLLKDYKFIGNIDADISFDSQYFELLIKKFEKNPRLGLAGGFIHEESNGRFTPRKFNNLRSVPHAVQFFKVNCFWDIGSYIPLPYGGEDWYAEVMARKNGWEVESFSDLPVRHHRKTSGAQGMIFGLFKQGYVAYHLGSHPVFEIAKNIIRIKGYPYILGSVLRTAGFTWFYIKNEKRLVSKEFVNYLRKEQMERLHAVWNPRPKI